MTAQGEIPAGTRAYAIGDIHGRLDLLEDLHRRIDEDFDAASADRGVVVHLGDYVDRGPASKEVIDYLDQRPAGPIESVYLKGNHEDFLLRFHDTGELGESWLMNGGGETLASYGIETGRDIFQALWELADIRRRFRNALPQSHLRFLRALSCMHREGGYVFVHAGIRPGTPIDQQADQDMMWIRDEFLFSDDDFGAVVVHGHTPRPSPVVRENRIGIDTMAFRSGVLTCLVLEGTQRRFITTAEH